MQFCAGGFIGWFILPFFLVHNLTHIGAITSNNIVFFAFIGLLVVVIVHCIQYTTMVLTEKHALYWTLLGSTEILLEDIENISKNKLRIVFEYKDGRRGEFQNMPKKDADIFYNEAKKLIQAQGE